MPPTLFWGHHRKTPHRWTRKDLLLAEALTLYENDICKGCGMPASMSYDMFNSGEFESRDDVTCLGCEQREQEESKLGPGQKRYVVNHLTERKPSPV
jgi:hypothetical protein